ncbi:MAG: hypothetical protein MI723_06580 [Caulobacterales bacterium]|nr:hypothetical protein [Caulobacterales bacterium]
MTDERDTTLRGALAAAALAALAASASARAEMNPITACRAAADAEARIACLEAALCRADSGLGGEAECRRAAGLDLAPEPAAPAAEAVEAAIADEAPARRRFGLPSIGFGRGGEEPAAVLPSDSPEAAALGADTVPVETGEARPAPTRIAATIVAFKVLAYDELQVELDNGQVWRQLSSDRPRVRLRDGDPMAVELWPSNFGGYRMRLVEQGVRLRVRRVR